MSQWLKAATSGDIASHEALQGGFGERGEWGQNGQGAERMASKKKAREQGAIWGVLRKIIHEKLLTAHNNCVLF